LLSISELDCLDQIRPEVIVADNNSSDRTFEHVNRATTQFPTTLRVIKALRPGKSAAINFAVESARGEIVAMLDDDVVVERNWLCAMADFFQSGEFQVGQGVIRLPAPERDDPEIQALVERYRTIPQVEYSGKLRTLHSLNGANFFVSRETFQRIGGLDERLGPGASGTSEDVDFARRLGQAKIAIGYAASAIVYHRVDRDRLTEEYFQQSHRRQGASRFLIRNQSALAIALDLARSVASYAVHRVAGTERSRYRSKGRIYHYLGMFEARRNCRRPAAPPH
jgi:GT2 family glycosyltransferase